MWLCQVYMMTSHHDFRDLNESEYLTIHTFCIVVCPYTVLVLLTISSSYYWLSGFYISLVCLLLLYEMKFFGDAMMILFTKVMLPSWAQLIQERFFHLNLDSDMVPYNHDCSNRNVSSSLFTWETAINIQQINHHFQML